MRRLYTTIFLVPSAEQVHKKVTWHANRCVPGMRVND